MTPVNIGTQRFTVVKVVDTPGAGGACHHYVVEEKDGQGEWGGKCFAWVEFQEGPILEAGVNGCFNEDLLAILIHRLEGFQSGEFACGENGMALVHLDQALRCLQDRTAQRQTRGGEGTHTV